MRREEPLQLDRMAVEEVGSNPERLAAAILDQLTLTAGPVPVEAIAAALDIVEIRGRETRGLEGALVTTEERGEGIILVRAGASRQRRRFTIAHELGHFLNIWHEPSAGGSFACSATDIGTPWQVPPPDAPRHWRQEAEASRFAIELLAPRRLIRSTALRGVPDLEKVLDLARDLDISREACARRWLELLDKPIALVFGQGGTVRYMERSQVFPFVTCRKGDRLPALPRPADATGLSHHDDADWRDWLGKAPQGDLVVQALHQGGGFTMALLTIDHGDDDEN